MIPNGYPYLKDYFGQESYKNYQDGYVDKGGNFLKREEALQRAQQVGQPVRDDREYSRELHSTDLRYMPASESQVKNPEVSKAADDYMKSTGMDRVPHRTYEPVSPELSKALADFYQSTPHVLKILMF